MSLERDMERLAAAAKEVGLAYLGLIVAAERAIRHAAAKTCAIIGKSLGLLRGINETPPSERSSIMSISKAVTKFNYGVRTVTSDNRRYRGFVQTGFTKAEAEAEAARLNNLGTLPGVTYEAAEVKANMSISKAAFRKLVAERNAATAAADEASRAYYSAAGVTEAGKVQRDKALQRANERVARAEAAINSADL